MSAGVVNKWKQDFTDALPLQNIGNTLSSWRYAPVSESEGQTPYTRSSFTTFKGWLTSKTFWRIVLIFAVILLLADLFSPARDAFKQHGWIDNNAKLTSSPSSEMLENPPLTDNVDWSQYAYCQYVTNDAYLCNFMMIFESLVRLGAKAERLMMYPEHWVVGAPGEAGRLLAKARDECGVRLMPIHVQHFEGEPTWADSFTKLLAFNQTEYKRVLSLDSDATVLEVYILCDFRQLRELF